MGKLNLSNWMSALDGDKLISEFSIPGTHDTGAGPQLTSVPKLTDLKNRVIDHTTRTQDFNLKEQLERGVRYLDIRLKTDKILPGLTVWHGPVYLDMDFEQDVLEVCYDFLRKNPSECIIMHIKDEAGSSPNFEAAFDLSINDAIDTFWYLNNTIPKLSAVKGKIVLLRRFSAAPANKEPSASEWNKSLKGIDVTGWGDNTTFEINNTSKLKIQDKFKSGINYTYLDKIVPVRALLDEAQTNYSQGKEKDRMYINYTSANCFPNVAQTPVYYAGHLNPNINYYLRNKTGRFGIIAVDFCKSLSNELIIKTNNITFAGSKFPVQEISTEDILPKFSTVVFNKKLYAAWQAKGDTNAICMSSSADGITWSPPYPVAYPGNVQSTTAAPSMTVFDNSIYMVYKANDSSNNIYITYSSDAINWSDLNHLSQATNSAPAVAAYGAKLYMAYRKNDESNQIVITSSNNGKAWNEPTLIHYNDSTNYQATPLPAALCSAGNKLYMTYRSNDENNYICITSNDGSSHWDFTLYPDHKQQTSTTPAITIFNNIPYIIYLSNDGDGILYYTSLNNGVWSESHAIPGQMSKSAPSVTVFKNKLCVIYNEYFTGTPSITCFDGTNWSDANPLPDGELYTDVPYVKAANKYYYLYVYGAQLYMQSSDNNVKWTAPVSVSQTASQAITNAAPSITSFNNKLYVFFKSFYPADSAVYYMIYDGSSWTQKTVVPKVKSAGSPSVTLDGGKLCLTYSTTGTGSDKYVTRMDTNGTWSDPVKSTKTLTKDKSLLSAMNTDSVVNT